MMIKHLDKENGTQPFNPMKSLQELALIYIVQFLSITKSLFNIVFKKYIYGHLITLVQLQWSYYRSNRFNSWER